MAESGVEITTQFTQALANRSVITEKDALAILAPIWLKHSEEEPTLEDMKNVITKINSNISNFGHEIKSFTHEILAKNFIVFNNKAEVDINLFQLKYNVAERNLFHRILDLIIVKDGYVTSWTSARNCLSDPKTHLRRDVVTESRYVALMRDWTAMGYFYQADDKVYLGVKAFSEFDTYFREVFPEIILACTLCKETPYWGIPCENCKHKFHKTCLRKYFRTNLKCPFCKVDWTTPLN